MPQKPKHYELIIAQLAAQKDVSVATSMQRFFPTPINALGVSAKPIDELATRFHKENPQQSVEEVIALSNWIIVHHQYHEEVLLAFALLNKVIGKAQGSEVLLLARHWLEHHVSNWAQVDSLAMKTLNRYLIKNLNEVMTFDVWLESNSPWCRRAAYVVWLKFVHQKIGKQTYQLPVDFIYAQCDRGLSDGDDYVQKAIGWLLKTLSKTQPDSVIDYLVTNKNKIRKSTWRYAIEKLSPTQIASMSL